MKNLKVVAFLLALISSLNVFSQEVGQPYISVDQTTFDAVTEWTNSYEKKQETSLDKFLMNKIGKRESDIFLNEFRKKSINSSNSANQKSLDDCLCALLILNKDNLNYPTFSTYPDNGSGSGLGWSWNRTRQTGVVGAVHNEYFSLTGNKSGSSYTALDNGDFSRSRITYSWTCINPSGNNIPSDCGCEKELRVEGQYDSKIRVAAEAKGIGSKAAFTTAEDAVVIYAYDHKTQHNTSPNVKILGAKIANISTYCRKTWNPDAVIDIVKLAGTVAAAIKTGGWSQTVIATTIPNQIAAIIEQPLIFNQGTTSSSSYAYEKTLSVNVHDYMLTLKPNIPKSLVVSPTWSLYGRGYGGDWKSEIKISSNFALGMIIKLDNSNPYCCIKQIGKYHYGTTSDAPSNASSLTASLNSFFNIYGPWNNSVSSSNSSSELVGSIDCPPLPQPCNPHADFTINGNIGPVVTPNVNNNLILDITNSVLCTNDYFISIQESDQNWYAFGPVNKAWIPANDMALYGGVGSFNLKQFNNTFGTFNFQAGKNYRVKVAVGNPWDEKVILAKIKTAKWPFHKGELIKSADKEKEIILPEGNPETGTLKLKNQ